MIRVVDRPREELRQDPDVRVHPVQLHSQCCGKGPTRTKTHMVDDTVICILRGCFTTVERTLTDHGNREAVYEMRRNFQDAMEDEFKAIVQGATQREVIAYMSQIHTDPDLAVELFMLEPTDDRTAAGGYENGAGPAR